MGLLTSVEQYTPRDYSALDVVAAAKRTADAILRANPLTNAVISRGLMRWTGNHVTGSGAKIDHLWIGEFFPPDPTMGGVPQKGFSLVRDDSTGGTSAFALYDHDPGGGGLGLRQTIHLESLDDQRLMSESRLGGQQWPEHPITMGPWGNDIGLWPGQATGSFDVLWHGWGNIVGRNLTAEYHCAGTGGAATEFKVRIYPNGGPVVEGPPHAFGVGAQGTVTDTIDVSSMRGETRFIELLGRVTNAVGTARASVTSFRCYSP